MTNQLVFAVAVLFLISAAASTGFACSCATPIDQSDRELVESEKLSADAVFIGRVVKIVKARDRRGEPLIDSYKAVFDVTERWKGPRLRYMRVNFFVGCCLCDYPFAKGKEYLVYASGDGQNLSASVCGRTKEATRTALKTDRQYLGASKRTVR